jgi:peptidase E
MGGLRVSGETGARSRGAQPLLAHAAWLTGASAPRACVINTASADDPSSYLRMYDMLAPAAGRVTHLRLFPMPSVSDPADLLLSQDLIFVGGGSVANMLAVWRVHGLDVVLRQAWNAGIVLSGVSAGAICWFTGGTTDSFGPDLRPYADGLGLLAGSYCPHYDSEPQRRPLFRSLIGQGALPAGIACDDGAAAHFADEDLAGIVADGPGAVGYSVRPADGGRWVESPLPAKLLDQA